MTGLFFDISDYIPDNEEMAVDSALARLRHYGTDEDYIYIPSISHHADWRERLARQEHNKRRIEGMRGNKGCIPRTTH